MGRSSVISVTQRRIWRLGAEHRPRATRATRAAATERQRVQGPVSTAPFWPRLDWIRSATATGDNA